MSNESERINNVVCRENVASPDSLDYANYGCNETLKTYGNWVDKMNLLFVRSVDLSGVYREYFETIWERLGVNKMVPYRFSVFRSTLYGTGCLGDSTENKDCQRCQKTVKVVLIGDVNKHQCREAHFNSPQVC